MNARSPKRIVAPARRGISLMEVLISAFIMAVGLLGVAALLPVGHHEASKGMLADRAAEIGRMAFRDFQIRGYDPANYPANHSDSDAGPGVYRQTFRCADDDRFTYTVWARREPYDRKPDDSADKQLNSNLDKIEEVVTVMADDNLERARMKYFPLNFVDAQQRMESDYDYYDVDNSKMRVVVFVFHTVDTNKAEFNPQTPAEGAPENRPVAVFEKIMPVEGTTSSWRS
jgi:hypothetical protein